MSTQVEKKEHVIPRESQKRETNAPGAAPGVIKEHMKLFADREMQMSKPKHLQTRMLINNEWVNAISGKTFPTINPCTEEKIADIPEANEEDVKRAVKAAKEAFKSWSKTSGYERSRLLIKVAELIENNADEIAMLESLDNGKPLETHSKLIDVPLSVQCFRYYAGWADKLQGKTIPIEGPYHAMTFHEPVGVVGQIIPWNFPLMMLAWKLAPALACGCTCVLKPSDKTPLSALRVGELFIEAGFPKGVVNIITGHGSEIGKVLALNPDVDKVAFTGSTDVGKKIMKYSAKSNLKKVTLELGGKSPNIVLDDCDFDKTVTTSVEACYMNAGQCCCAGTRLLVQDTIYDKFVQKCAEAAKERKVGNPFLKETQQGPVIDEGQFKRILEYIDIGKKEGARLVCGGNRIGDKGYFIEPTIFADVTDKMRICKEEIFGPVLVIEKFSTMEEAIEKANNTIFGLAAAIFTKDVQKYIKLMKDLQAGTVWINCYNVLDSALPFGGYKQSGIGRELGEYCLSNYLQVKSVCVNIE